MRTGRIFAHFVLYVGGAERKGEFAGVTIRQHGMVQLTRGQQPTLYKTKVVIDVCVTRLRDELGMTFGVDVRFVDPGV